MVNWNRMRMGGGVGEYGKVAVNMLQNRRKRCHYRMVNVIRIGESVICKKW